MTSQPNKTTCGHPVHIFLHVQIPFDHPVHVEAVVIRDIVDDCPGKLDVVVAGAVVASLVGDEGVAGVAGLVAEAGKLLKVYTTLIQCFQPKIHGFVYFSL